jgi:hypothetical protein
VRTSNLASMLSLFHHSDAWLPYFKYSVSICVWLPTVCVPKPKARGPTTVTTMMRNEVFELSATSLLTGRSGDRIRLDLEIFSFLKLPDRLCVPPRLLFSGHSGHFLGEKRWGREANHSLPTSAEVTCPRGVEGELYFTLIYVFQDTGWKIQQ